MSRFEDEIRSNRNMLMEGALAERLKREYNILIDEEVALASSIYNEKNRKILKRLFAQYIEIARNYNLPIMITTPTRRANKERVSRSNYDEKIINDNVLFLKEIKSESSNNRHIFIGGLMGCYGDAYKSDEGLESKEAYNFHTWQANLFKETEVDYLFAGIMPTIDEAVGIAKAMEATNLPYIISFMIKKDGRLLDGTTINDAIKIIDKSVNREPLCYMTNCVHPDILYEALSKDYNNTNIVRNRFKGIQANAACLSPEELDNSFDLISSDPISLTDSMMRLREKFNLNIFGGCCGTDDKYIDEIAKML